MSHQHSSPDLGPASSPSAVTDPTVYSPEVVRGRVIARAVAGSATPTFINGIQYTRLYPHPHINGVFSNELDHKDPEHISRFLRIKSLQNGAIPAGADQEMELTIVLHLMKIYEIFSHCSLYYWNGVYLRFDSLEQACTAKQLLKITLAEVVFVDSYEFARAKSMDTMAINEFEGQVQLVVKLQPYQPEDASIMPPFFLKDIVWLNAVVDSLMNRFGTILALVHVATDQDAMLFTYRIEFHSFASANRAVASLTKDRSTGLSPDYAWRWFTEDATHWTGDRAPNSPHRHQPRYDDQGRISGYHLQETHQDRAVKMQSFKGPNTYESHNRVRRERISDGTDVRTTIMLRNIPNKLDWMSLVAVLNDVCYGKFDFVYLRIDFKSCNNVGYAFVNFSDISGMLDMLDRVEGRGWTGFKSSKFAEISYATIQGREALTQKFRNSSVMQEAPFCRPHLFIPYNHAHSKGQRRATGSEDIFPGPDNWSKVQRSVESARSLGLFPPSGIQQNVNHRGLVSDYDRGTPRDMIHVANMQRQFGPVPTFPGVPENQRRECELWYAQQYGASQNGLVPFAHIPFGLVQQFLQSHAGSVPVTPAPYPGVIGRPTPQAPRRVSFEYGSNVNYARERGSPNGY